MNTKTHGADAPRGQQGAPIKRRARPDLII